MSCRSTSGGSVSTSLARMVSGLDDKDIQHLFHALKREGEGQPAPSELALTEWRERQQHMLERAARMSEKRKDALRNKLFRSRAEPVPDGSMFYAWSRIEARARQEAVIRSITDAVDLDPPGSQADQYELGEDGRPLNVMYASYGSNLHRDRFMTYIQGGTPPGGRRHYPGCTDTTEPEFDIPIRYEGGYRTHFALTSSVWRGGIAFLDKTDDDPHASALGRAYKLSIDQFDEVVHFENGGFVAKTATKVPLDEVLTTGRAVTGPGSYETMLHIGDYKGMPVITFTAPFSAHEALSHSGTLTRNAVRLPVRTNKPSPAYCRMIGSGLQETFGIDEVQAADLLRGMPGGDRYSRAELVKVLREPAPAAPANPDKKVGYTPVTSPTFSGSGTWAQNNEGGSPSYMKPDDLKSWIANYHAQTPDEDRPPRRTARNRKPKKDDADTRLGRATPNKDGEYLPGVRTYATITEQEESVDWWNRTVRRAKDELDEAKKQATFWAERDADGLAAKDAAAALTRAEAVYAETRKKRDAAKAQTPANYFPPADTYFKGQWETMANRARTEATSIRMRLDAETAKDPDSAKVASLTRDLRAAEARQFEATAKSAKASQGAYGSSGQFASASDSGSNGTGGGAAPSGNTSSGGTQSARAPRSKGSLPAELTRRPTGEFYAGVKTYTSLTEQAAGISKWRRAAWDAEALVRHYTGSRDYAQERLKRHPDTHAERELARAMKHLDLATARRDEVRAKLEQASAQTPSATREEWNYRLRRLRADRDRAAQNVKIGQAHLDSMGARSGNEHYLHGARSWLDRDKDNLAELERRIAEATAARDAIPTAKQKASTARAEAKAPADAPTADKPAKKNTRRGTRGSKKKSSAKPGTKPTQSADTPTGKATA